jgi:hypothetical protein
LEGEEMDITTPLWIIPTIITAISCGYALFVYDDEGGLMSGIGNIILLVPALFMSMIAWILWGIFK